MVVDITTRVTAGTGSAAAYSTADQDTGCRGMAVVTIIKVDICDDRRAGVAIY